MVEAWRWLPLLPRPTLALEILAARGDGWAIPYEELGQGGIALERSEPPVLGANVTRDEDRPSQTVDDAFDEEPGG